MFREYKRLLLCVLSVYLSLYTMAEDFKTYKSGTYFKVKTIRRNLNRSIITKTYMTDSISVCSYKCVKLKSLSLYFVTVEKICFCNNGLDGSDISDSKKPEVLYAVLVQEVEVKLFMCLLSLVSFINLSQTSPCFYVCAVPVFLKPWEKRRTCSLLQCFLPFWRSFHHFHKS